MTSQVETSGDVKQQQRGIPEKSPRGSPNSTVRTFIEFNFVCVFII